MTLKELYDKTSRIIQRLDAEIERQAHRAGLDLVALVTNRVVQTGKDSKGSLFSPYSTNQVPAFLYFGKSRTGGGEARVRAAAKKGQRISYRDFRVLNNLNPGPKNFEFTGLMWRGFGVVKTEKTADGVRVVLGGTNTVSDERITKNTERENKSIIQPSQQELAIISRNLQQWFLNIVRTA
jgi:hypothetical protein